MAILAPLTEAGLNSLPPGSVNTKPSSVNQSQIEEDCLSKASSSPFQTEVSAPRETSRPILNPSKKANDRKSSPNKRAFDFVIHEDCDDASNDENDPTFRFSPHKRSLTSSHSQEVTPSKAPLPQSMTNTQNLDLTDPHMFDFAVPHCPVSNHSLHQNSRDDGDDLVDTSFAASTSSEDTRFSTFSAVPNADMTLFAKLGSQTPTAQSPFRPKNGSTTPTNTMFATPQTSRRTRGGSPTPKQSTFNHAPGGDTTNLLLDFTEQFNAASGKNLRSSTEPNLLAHIKSQRNPSPAKVPRTPGGSHRKLLNLLDFELPPAPTPRSIPSITIRELESMKSSYLSEISSLRASLSGREAEIESLKKAVMDAEHRAGQAMERAQNETNAREYAEKEKNDWVKKGKEVEELLKDVRMEVLESEKEKEDLTHKLDEANRLREEAEWKAASAATQASVAQSEVGVTSKDVTADVNALVQEKFTAQIDERLELLARELHQVYKEKHESKVSTLKKTYNIRFDKKIGELQLKINDLTKTNEELQAARDATLSEAIPEHVLNGNVERAAELQKRVEQQKSEIEEAKARLAGFARELESARDERAHILQELERERVEKGELVAAVDEMLSLQQADVNPGAAEVVEDFRKSMTRPTALRPTDASLPTLAQSRIGRPPQSRMMSNIAKMGAGRGAE